MKGQPMDNVNPHFKPIRVYLESVIVSGMLPSKHPRLSDYFNLAAGYECFALKDSSAEDFDGHPFPVNTGEFLIYKPEVILVTDMRETEAGSSGVNLERIDKEGRKVMLSVGPFLLPGKISHLTRKYAPTRLDGQYRIRSSDRGKATQASAT